MSPKKSNSCAPPKDSTYLTVGQDLFSIQEYVSSQYNASLHQNYLEPMKRFYPAAFMVYTDLAKLEGLDRPADYGSGIEFSDGVLDSLFPGQDVGIQIGLWLAGDEGCGDINAGRMDGQIEKLIRYVRHCTATQVFLRVGYEFDNPQFDYIDPDGYIMAFKRIVSSFRAKLDHREMERIQFVWHSWAAPRLHPLESYYPGHDFVDWVGVSVFQQVYPWSQESSSYAGGTLANVEEVLAFAKNCSKPTIIAESTPFGGIDMNTNETVAYGLTDAWDRWFMKVMQLIDDWDISMWSYINCDWDSQPMWHGIGFGETRISADDTVMRKWRDLVLARGGGREYLMAGSLASCGHKNEKEKSHFVLGDDVRGNTEQSISSGMITSRAPMWTYASAFLFGGMLVSLIVIFAKKKNADIEPSRQGGENTQLLQQDI